MSDPNLPQGATFDQICACRVALRLALADAGDPALRWRWGLLLARITRDQGDAAAGALAARTWLELVRPIWRALRDATTAGELVRCRTALRGAFRAAIDCGGAL